MDWTQKTVLVTGAGGFIGSHLVERLVDLGATTKALVARNPAGSGGWPDSSPVKDSVEVIIGDIRDEDGLQRWFRGVDTVFHLAALTSVPDSLWNPQSYFQTNVEGTFNVLQAAREAGVKSVVHTSSSAVYGSARYIPMDEDHPLQARSPYAATKIAADKLAESFHRSFDLPVAVIRPFNTYGPGQSAGAVIPSIIKQALTESQVRLGSLAPERDFNFVADTVEGYIRVAGCPAAVGQAINIGGGQSISIEALASTILELMGKDIPIVQEDRQGRTEESDVDRLCSDNTRARDLLGWQPQYTLEDGLSQVIDWVRGDLDRCSTGSRTPALGSGP